MANTIQYPYALSEPLSYKFGCVARDIRYHTPYGYFPSLSAGIVFAVLFGLATIFHTAVTIKTRKWWYSAFAAGAVSETLGWAARIWSAECPYNGNAFLMQISTLIFAPVFFAWGIYVILKEFIQIIGEGYSFIGPKTYLWIFCSCDVFSLVLQAAGGGLASAESDKVGGNTKLGTNIMVAGIIFQLVSMSMFVFFFASFMWRSRRSTMWEGKIKSLVYAAVLSLAALYVRSVYRTIELLQGWSGYLITHERYFVALDGAMMVFCIWVFVFVCPQILLEKIDMEGAQEKAGRDVEERGPVNQ